MTVITVVEYLSVQAREPISSRAEPHYRAREVTEPSLARLAIPPSLTESSRAARFQPYMGLSVGLLSTKRRYIQQLSVAEMRMLRWICGHTRLDRVRNDDIRNRLGVAPIEEKLIQHRLRWFGHVHRRRPEALVHRGIIKRDNNVKRGRGRPNLT
jgi:hypothetical protein